MSKTSIAAIVLNYNGFENTFECINSLLQIESAELTIYLIDNASSDGSGEKLRLLFPHVRFSQLRENYGYAGGNNAGLKQAYADGFYYFLVVNNDIVVEKNFLQPMLKLIQENSHIGVVTCKVLYKDNPTIINAAGGRFSKFMCSGVNRKIGEINDGKIEVKEIDFIPGMLFLMRRDVIDKVGFINEKFFLYYEDLDYSFKIRDYFKMFYISEGRVYHRSGGGKRGKSYSDFYLYYHTRNRIWMFQGTSFFYQGYVILFSFLNVIMKTFIVLIEIDNLKNNWRSRLKKLKFLWLGFIHGLGRRQHERLGFKSF